MLSYNSAAEEGGRGWEWCAPPGGKMKIYIKNIHLCTQHTLNCKCKGKVHPRTGHEGPEGEKRYSWYSSTLPSTSALYGVGGQRHAPAALPPGKTRYPLYRRLGGPQGRSGRVRKISHPPEFDPRTVQPVASCYSDCSIPAHTLICIY